MHVSEGVLSGPALAAGAVLAVGGLGLGLRRMNIDSTPKTAMISAVFFVAALIHIPFGPSNVHLILNGLAGIFLGWTVFPALAVALCLQAVMFQYGGLTVLGVNLLIMALPGVCAHYLFRFAAGKGWRAALIFWWAVGLGCATVACSGFLLTVFLALGGRGFLGVAVVIVAAHIPVMIADGLVTGAAIRLILKVRPDLLDLSSQEQVA